jgi:outer membrane protein assembly factor BamB
VLPLSRILPVLSILLLAPAFALADWPLFRGNPLMTGVAPPSPIPFPEELDEKWTFKTGDAIESAPAVVNGVVYVSSLDKHLYALDLATGKLKWKVKLAHMKASPSVKGDRIYIGDLNGKFHCINSADGKVLWSFEAEGEIHASANFHGENVIFGSHDAKLYCLSPDGKKIWVATTEGPINAAAAVAGDLTFATGCSDGILHVIDARTGKELGSIDLQGQTLATGAVVGDHIYISMESNQVVAADLKSMKKLWTFEPARRAQAFRSSAAVAHGIVVAGSRDKKVYGLNSKTGAEVWSFQAEGQVDASPVIVGNRVYVGCLSNDGNFYVLDLKTGKKIQELELDSPVCGSVGVGPDCVLVGTDRGTLYCLGKK